MNPLPRAFVNMEKELEDLKRDIFARSGLSKEETYDVFFQIYLTALSIREQATNLFVQSSQPYEDGIISKEDYALIYSCYHSIYEKEVNVIHMLNIRGFSVGDRENKDVG